MKGVLSLLLVAGIGLGLLVVYKNSNGSTGSGTLDDIASSVSDAVDSVSSTVSDGVGAIMGNLSAAQIAVFAANAGFQGQDLITAVSVALAESSGNPNAHGDTTLGSGTGSFGLWQIYSDAHPEFGPNFVALYDPQANANAAYSIYANAGHSFRPWSTFGSGAYAKYTSSVTAALNA